MLELLFVLGFFYHADGHGRLAAGGSRRAGGSYRRDVPRRDVCFDDQTAAVAAAGCCCGMGHKGDQIAKSAAVSAK